MRARLPFIVLGFILGTISIGVVYAWTGPTESPPGGNVAAPVNVGSGDQVKAGGLGVGFLDAGHLLLSDTDAYLNFGDTAGESGYGLRDNAGTLEFKNSGGAWDSVQSIVYNLVGGSGNVPSGTLCGKRVAMYEISWGRASWTYDDIPGSYPAPSVNAPCQGNTLYIASYDASYEGIPTSIGGCPSGYSGVWSRSVGEHVSGYNDEEGGYAISCMKD